MKKLLLLAVFLMTTLPFLVNAQGCMDDGGSDEGVKVKGYIQPQININQTDNGWDESHFLFNRARIGFVGNIPYDVSYYVFAELSPFKTGNPYLLDAFVSYSRLKFAKVSLGQFKVPFSLELNTPCQSLHTINRSLVVSELATPDRDRGFMISGGHDTFLFTYSVGLFNGTGILTQNDPNFVLLKPDNNMGKDVVGRIVFHPFDFLNVGGSFKYGTSPNTDPTMDDNVTKRFAGELEFKMNKILVQGEYIYGEDIGTYTTGGGCGEPLEFHTGSVKRAGMFVQAMYKTDFLLQPVLKYENYNTNLDVDNTTNHVTTFGLNYFLNDWTRIQINYLYKAEEAKEKPNDCILIQLQAKF